MKDKMTDAELLAALSSALKPDPSAIDQITLSRLRMTMTNLNAEPLYSAVTKPSHATMFGWIARRVRNHTSTFLVALVSILGTGGVATAAVVTDRLPGPTRAIAYDLGLPVTSPALHQAQQKLAQVKKSLTDHDLRTARNTGNQLAQDMQGLNQGDLSQIQDSADDVLNQVGVSIPPGSTTSTTTSTTLDSSEQTPTNAATPNLPSGDSESGAPSPTTTSSLPTDTVPSDQPPPETTTTQLDSSGSGSPNGN